MDDIRNIHSTYLQPFLTVIKYFRSTGIDLFDERKNLLKIKYLHVVMFALHVITMICHWRFIVQEMKRGVDLLDIIIDLCYSYCAIEGCLLYIHFIYGKNKIKSFVFHLSEEWRDNERLSQDIVTYRRKEIRSFDRFHFVFLAVTQAFVIVYTMAPLMIVIFKKFILKTDVTYMVPFRLTTPFKYEDNFAIYLVVYGVIYVMTQSLSFLINGSILLLTVCIMQLRVQFDLLQKEFTDIFTSQIDVDMDQKIKRTVTRHTKLLDLTHELSSAFGAVFAIHVFFLSAVICFYCVTTMINGRLEDLKTIMGSIISIINIYNCCYNGQLLADSASDVATALYNSNWYSLSWKYKKIVLIIILRSQRPTYIQSTSYARISLTTFIKIMNVAWSFISLITGMYEEN